VYGITFEQGRNDLRIDAACLENIVTENKTLSPKASATRSQVAAIIMRFNTLTRSTK